VEESKSGWKSLKDKLRYRQGKGKVTLHSGDSGGEESQSDSVWSEEANERVLQGWKFGESLKFIVEKPYSRR